MADIATYVLTGLGLMFFLAGTVGLIRFPDTFSRLHALTKADNLGLGLTALGIAFQAQSWREIALLALIWALVLLSAGTVAQLVARTALNEAASNEAALDDSGSHEPGLHKTPVTETGRT
ncbi:MAG: cation:proton antiporter [Rhodobacterales bacterium]